MTRPTPLHKPGPHLAELAIALDGLSRAQRARLAAVLGRLADDLGWSAEIRGVALVIFGMLEDDATLAETIERIERIEGTGAGSLAFVLEPQ